MRGSLDKSVSITFVEGLSGNTTNNSNLSQTKKLKFFISNYYRFWKLASAVRSSDFISLT